MTTFQKIIVSMLGVFAIIVGYYFLVVLPKHNSEIIAIQAQQLEIEAEEKKILLEQKQKQLEIEEEKRQEEMEDRKREMLDTEIERCNQRGEAMKEEYNNIFRVFYDYTLEDCYVEFLDDNDEIVKIQIDQGNTKPKEEQKTILKGMQVIRQGVNLREGPSTSSSIIQVINPTNVVDIINNIQSGDTVWYNIKFFDKTGRVADVAFEGEIPSDNIDELIRGYFNDDRFTYTIKKRVGDFVMINGGTGPGTYIRYILKKNGNSLIEVEAGNSDIECELMDQYSVPTELYRASNCYDKTTKSLRF